MTDHIPPMFMISAFELSAIEDYSPLKLGQTKVKQALFEARRRPISQEMLEIPTIDLKEVPIKDLVDELEQRFDPDKNEYDPGVVNIHSFHCGEEGVIVKYEPCGLEGKDKKPRTLQYGIYNARILVMNDDERE